jgi:hypothetical protein
MNRAIKKIFNALKERRFTATARVLGEEKACHASVSIVNVKGTAPAWWDSSNKRITLNDAEPRQRNEKLTLIWERGKLYHELFHLIFTTDDELRTQLAVKSNDRDKYLWISNALEDGRIEWHGDRLYEGCTPYIRTVLKELVCEDSAASGLLIYVRTRLWRNSKEEAFWKKYEGLINQCIEAPCSSFVWSAAFSIVEDMLQNQPKQPEPEGKGNPQPQPQNAQDDQDEAESEQSDEDTQDTENEATEAPEGEEEDSGEEPDGEDIESDEDSEESDDGEENEGEGESLEDDGEFDDFPETPKPQADKDSAEESEGEGGSDLESVPTSVDEDVQSQLEDMVDEAVGKVDQEVKDELVELHQELADYEAPQEYASHSEESDATELGELFNSLQVESSRQRYQPCKYGGTLDPDRLIDTRTDGMFMHESVDRPAQPHIVLLIDESCSMQGDAIKVSEAARILCGAIRASGAKSVAVSFGCNATSSEDAVAMHPVVPVEGLKCEGYSTPTHLGLRAAQQWLDEQQARRGMVVVITDGQPDSVKQAGAAFEELKANGYFVLNVIMGTHLGTEDSLRLMCHEFVRVENARELLGALEPPLSGFMAGAF